MFKKLLLSLLAILGFTFLLSSGNIYAVSDTVVYADASNRYDNLCRSTPSGNCSEYSYFLFESVGQSFDRGASISFSTGGNYSLNYFPATQGQILLGPNASVGGNINWSTYSSAPNGWQIRITMSETNPVGSGIIPEGSISITENGTFDVTNYASAVVNVPQTVTDLPPYSELVVDSFWKYHVAIAGGLASIFAIFVVYRIIKSRLR